jgi:hypothetical protein
MSDPLLTYQDCAAYFKPPKHPDTIYDWIRAAKLKVFHPTKRTVAIRKSVWEKYLKSCEKKIGSDHAKG